MRKVYSWIPKVEYLKIFLWEKVSESIDFTGVV
jgi:hypothetical protein